MSDYQESGNADHFYRIKAGRFPLAEAAFPLGLQKGKTAAIQLTGYNLGADKFDVKGEASPEDMRAVIFRPAAPKGPACAPTPGTMSMRLPACRSRARSRA